MKTYDYHCVTFKDASFSELEVESIGLVTAPSDETADVLARIDHHRRTGYKADVAWVTETPPLSWVDRIKGLFKNPFPPQYVSDIEDGGPIDPTDERDPKNW